MSKAKLEKYKCYFESGFWTLQMVKNLVDMGKITEEEFQVITGQDICTKN